jgi:hypothetical protein
MSASCGVLGTWLQSPRPAIVVRLPARSTGMATQEGEVARSDVIDSLIATYRELNLQLRPLSDDALSAGGADGSVKDVLKEMRKREIYTSQQLKAMLLADAAGAPPDAVDPTLIESGDELPARVILSEFGTARESILAAALQRSQEDLDRELPSADGPRSISSLLETLVEHDKTDRAKIERIRSGS